MRGLLRRAEKEVNTSENALLPVNRLPPEILQHIFRLATRRNIARPQPLSNASIAAGDIWSLIEFIPDGASAIASVCRHWRSVFLADATFRVLIHDRQDRGPLTIARQSRAALELRLLATRSHAVLDLVKSEAHRIRAVHWEKANTRRSDLGLLATSGCRFEKLVLGMSPHLPAVEADILQPILNTQTAYLQWLTLRDCKNLPEIELPQLTGLHLDGCPGPEATRSLYALLARAPKLTDLVLSRVLLADSTETSLTRTPLPLPQLRRLVFADEVSPESIAAFLRCVDLSPDASIRVHAGPHPALFAGLMRTSAFRDATAVYVSTARDGVVISGPHAAVHFAAREMLCALLGHVIAMNGLRMEEVWLLGDVCRGAGLLPAFPQSVKRIVVHDVGLAVALGALQRREHREGCVDAAKADSSLGPDCRFLDGRREGITVRVLMTRFMSVSSVLMKLASWAEARTTHVVVGCLPGYKGDRSCSPDFERSFASLEIRDQVEEPKPTLPDVCTKAEHCLWPAWLE